MDALLEKIYALNKTEMEACARHLTLGGGTRGMPVITHGKGVRIHDTDGKDYIDCTSQSWAMYLGFANLEEAREAMVRVKKTFTPNPRPAPAYDAAYHRYCALNQGLKSLW